MLVVHLNDNFKTVYVELNKERLETKLPINSQEKQNTVGPCYSVVHEPAASSSPRNVL